LKILIEASFSKPLLSILLTIAKDKKTAAKKFNKELRQKISLLSTSPHMCRSSIYFDDTNYRDLIYKGYIIIYKIDTNTIKVLDIFKWQDKD